MDHTKPFDPVKARRPFPGFNSLARVNNKTKTTECWWSGSTSAVQEPVFIPRSKDAPEGDGYVLFLCNRYETNLTDLVILDTAHWHEPTCVINLPIRLRSGYVPVGEG
jgi:carotenoid cleavage dioxygenase-like enzyme